MLTTREAAKTLGVTPDHVRHLIRSGKLKATAHGRDWAIDPADLEALERKPPGRPKKEAK